MQSRRSAHPRAGDQINSANSARGCQTDTAAAYELKQQLGLRPVEDGMLPQIVLPGDTGGHGPPSQTPKRPQRRAFAWSEYIKHAIPLSDQAILLRFQYGNIRQPSSPNDHGNFHNGA